MVIALWLLLLPLVFWRGPHGAFRPQWRLWLEMTALGAVSGLILWSVFVFGHLDIERNAPVLWPWAIVSALGLGIFGVRRSQRIPIREILLTVGTGLACGATLLSLSGDFTGLADARARALLIATVLALMSIHLGASTAYLLWESDKGFSFESIIGRRFLLAKSSKALSTVTTISVVGVILGVWLVIVSLAILGGFGGELERKIIGANANIVVEKNKGRPFSLTEKDTHAAGHQAAPLLQRVQELEGIEEATPFVKGEVAVASGSNFSPAVLFGVDPKISPKVLGVLKPPLFEGDLCPLLREAGSEYGAAPHDNQGRLVLEERLASRQGLKVGDTVGLALALGESVPQWQPFTVSAIVDSRPNLGGLGQAVVSGRWGDLFANEAYGGGFAQAWREFSATLARPPPTDAVYVHIKNLAGLFGPEGTGITDIGDKPEFEMDEGFSALLALHDDEGAWQPIHRENPLRLVGVDSKSRFGSMHALRKRLRVGELCTMQWDGEPQVAAKARGLFAPPSPLPNIVIGAELQKILNVRVGDKLRVISPVHERMTPVGMVPSSQGFRVAGVFRSQMYEIDARFCYVTLAAGQRFFELGDHEISGLQVHTRTADSADRLGAELEERLGEDYQALDWKRRNQTLFAALKLERVVTFVVLVFIILVASFSIVNTLSMSIIEKRKEIAILKTMGARNGSIMKIFLVQGMLVGSFGIGVGAVLALLTVLALERFGFWIPAQVYYIDSLPVKLSFTDIIFVALAALIIVWDFAVFPALGGAKLDPVEGLRET